MFADSLFDCIFVNDFHAPLMFKSGYYSPSISVTETVDYCTMTFFYE